MIHPWGWLAVLSRLLDFDRMQHKCAAAQSRCTRLQDLLRESGEEALKGFANEPEEVRPQFSLSTFVSRFVGMGHFRASSSVV